MNLRSCIRALRPLLRVEFREMGRNRQRTALLLALIALPVAAVTAAATLTEIARPTGDERRTARLGVAALRLDVVATQDPLRLHPWQAIERARDRLGADVETAVLFDGVESISSVPPAASRTVQGRLLAAEPATFESGGLGEGMIGLKRGRYPRNAGEVALSSTLLDLLEVGLGERVTLEYGRDRTIVGEVFDPEGLDEPVVVRRLAAMEQRGRYLLLADGKTDDFDDRGRWAALLPELEPTWATQEWPEDPTLTLFVFGIALLGCFEAALVVAAAVAIGLRRRQVQIGLLGAVGADALRLGGGLISAHLLLGAAASGVGVVSGWLAAWALRPWSASWSNRLVGPFEISPTVSLLAWFLGVLVVTTAVAAPAWRAAHVPVKDALAGRRPQTDAARWMARAGGCLLVAATLTLALSTRGSSASAALAGLIAGGLVILAVGLLSPTLLGAIGRRASALPLVPRLAVRDAGRFRQRNGAVVTAIIAGMAMSVTVAGLTRGLDQAVGALPPTLRADQLLIHGPGAEQAASEIAADDQGLLIAPLRAAYLRGEPLRVQPDAAVDRFRTPWVAVGDERLLQALGMDVGPANAAPRDRLLALDPGDARLDDPTQPVHLATWIDGTHQITPAVSVVRTGLAVRAPAFVLPSALAKRLDVETGPPPRRTSVPWLVRQPPSTHRNALRPLEQRLSEMPGVTVDSRRTASEPLRNSYFGVFLLSLAGGFTLVWIATALSSEESRQDEDTLHIVGADRTLVRRLAATRSTVLALLGCGLALVPGLMVTRALISLASLPIPFVVPWFEISLTLTVLPTLVYLGTRWKPTKWALRARSDEPGLGARATHQQEPNS